VAATALRVGSGKPLEPRNITLANNLLQATGQAINVTTGSDVHAASNLVSAGSVNIQQGFVRQDAQLMMLGELFRPGPASPRADAAAAGFDFVQVDIDGRPRPMPDIGAQELGDAAIGSSLLSAADVGPAAP